MHFRKASLRSPAVNSPGKPLSWWRWYKNNHLNSLEIFPRAYNKWKNILQENPTLSKGRESLRHWRHSLLPPLEKSSTPHRCGQEGNAPFPLSSQQRKLTSTSGCRPPRPLLSANSQLQKLSPWWLWLRCCGPFLHPDSTHKGKNLPQVCQTEKTVHDCIQSARQNKCKERTRLSTQNLTSSNTVFQKVEANKDIAR